MKHFQTICRNLSSYIWKYFKSILLVTFLKSWKLYLQNTSRAQNFSHVFRGTSLHFEYLWFSKEDTINQKVFDIAKFPINLLEKVVGRESQVPSNLSCFNYSYLKWTLLHSYKILSWELSFREFLTCISIYLERKWN